MGVRALFLVACILAISGLDAAAVERINPHDVLNQTRRDLNTFDKRRERDKAEQQKQEKEAEAKRKQDEAERQKAEKSEKALQEAQRKREAAEQQTRAREEKEREARQIQDEAERLKPEQAEKALQEAAPKGEGAEQQKRAREEKDREARQKQEEAERQKAEKALQEARQKQEVEREQAEKALQDAQRKHGTAATEAEGASLSSPTTTPSRPAGRAGSKSEEDPTVTASVHPAGPHHLPAFFTAPGETDVLMVGVAAFLVIAVVTVGILFLRLHTLPERIAHKSHKLQFEIVAVLGLLALFTHVHLFWVAGLLLAMIDLPDFGWPLGRIAGAVETMAGMKPGEGAAHVPNGTVIGTTPAEAPVEAPAQTRVQPRETELTHA